MPVSVATNSPGRLNSVAPAASRTVRATDLKGWPAKRWRKKSDQPAPPRPTTSKPLLAATSGAT